MNRIMSVAALVLLAASSARGQTPGFDGLQSLKATKATVSVTDTTGRQFRGQIIEISNAELTLQMASTRRQFTLADVRTVRARKEDPLLNGTLIGAATGAGLTSLIFLDNECRDDPSCSIFVAVYGSIGALIGTGIDALIHRQIVVYSAPRTGSDRTIAIRPLVDRRGRGVRVTITF